jgi:hypothetical protein
MILASLLHAAIRSAALMAASNKAYELLRLEDGRRGRVATAAGPGAMAFDPPVPWTGTCSHAHREGVRKYTGSKLKTLTFG